MGKKNMKSETSTERGIRRVVWIPHKLDQLIENLRCKMGYTRSGFFRYALTRYVEQILFLSQRKLQLQPWQEIVGTLKEIKTNSDSTTAIISCIRYVDYIITYPNQTQEAKILQTLNNLKGQKISILRTDNPQKPLLVKTFNETVVTHKNFLSQLWFRKRASLVAFMMIALKFFFTIFELRL